MILMHTGGGGGGNGLPYKKDGGARQKFEKNPKEVPRSCLVGVA